MKILIGNYKQISPNVSLSISYEDDFLASKGLPTERLREAIRKYYSDKEKQHPIQVIRNLINESGHPMPKIGLTFCHTPGFTQHWNQVALVDEKTGGSMWFGVFKYELRGDKLFLVPCPEI